MRSFNWLHLTDLHFGLQGQAVLWPNIREAFWNDLEWLHKKCGPWDAVLFSGDLVQSGSATEFTELENKVLGPLWEHLAKLGTIEPVLLAIPGNHDLVRPDAENPTAALRWMTQKDDFAAIAEEFWTKPSCEYRKITSEAFENYQAWNQSNARNKALKITPGILPGDFATTLEIRKGDGPPLKIGVAGINTTFLQLTKGDFRNRLALDSRQLHHACGEDLPAWIEAHDACILMTHQGPDWLDETSKQVYSEINPAGRFAVHLFGHMHANTVRSNASGGGKIIRQWQGCSLFGLEKFGEPPHQIDRKHGYAAGRIEFEKEGAVIRHWPRLAFKDDNGWRFRPDHNSCVIDEQDSGTKPERLDISTVDLKSAYGPEGDMSEKATQLDTPADRHMRHLEEMSLELQHSLEFFKGQPRVFVEPKLSKTREFNDEPNELKPLMEKPTDTLIIAPPEFGLTCLGLYLQVEAFRKNNLWLYIDAEQTKARKIANVIDQKLLHYEQKLDDLKCIILDNWNAEIIDHNTMVKNISDKCPNTPIIILAEDSLSLDATGNLAKLHRNFALLHLQALSRSSMRKLVSSYNATKRIGTDDVVLASIAGHLESINIHRTPLNCYTLLRVLDSSYNEKLINKSKLLKAILFVLFTDFNSFSFLSNKPEVEESTFALGCFCKDLVKEKTRYFDASTLVPKLEEICEKNSISLDVRAMLEILIENNILVRHESQMAFRHRYWIFYFAAEWMQHDDAFRQFILNNRNYVNYPEIIEFYTGVDGRRSDAIETLFSDLTLLIDQVDDKIGIERPFDPLSSLLWNPTEEYVQHARSQIAEKVESSNLPAEIKDKHADGQYLSTAPYDQSIRSFLTDYSVLSLLHIIKAASFALRSSPFVASELKNKLTGAILEGWEEMSRVVFWLSPLLAKEGRAIHDGFAIMLHEGFSEDVNERSKEIIISTPSNVVRILHGDLMSKKIGPMLYACFQTTESKIQKHMIALFIATVRPVGWFEWTLNYINLLHPMSFYLGNIFGRLNHEVTHGDFEPEDERSLKTLVRAIISKREYAPKSLSTKEIPPDKLLSDENKLSIDKLYKGNRQSWSPP